MFHERINESFLRKITHIAPAKSAPRLRMGCHSVQHICHDLSGITHQSTTEM